MRPILYKSAIAAAVCALLDTAGIACAEPEEMAIDPGHTFPTFEVGHLGIATQRGRFNRTAGTITLDRTTGSVSGDIKIDARSVETGNDVLDTLLRGRYYFNVDDYPEIWFRITNGTLVEGKPSSLDGQLHFLGVLKPVQLKVLNYKCTRLPSLVSLRCGVDLTTTFRRSDFGMMTMLGFVSDDVTMNIQAEAERPQTPRSPETKDP